ncbi:MAG TPA: serine/threonine-protein kinase, partial [Gemmatimonadales bacterium]|nr:serine/threonine-protein kinase [Gemmatimonadales bacterium]
LSHPLIVPLYDSGSAGGVLYYIMPFVEGESLYERLERERQLPLDEAVRIAVNVADALGYAHGRGVLHRDVKPENILLAGGHALMADFGLARAIGAADYQKLTETGIIVGTIFYMSPEQLKEDRGLDQRADIYSLGCILFEMLTGAPPYTGTSLKDVAMKILRAPVPSARRVRPEVPIAVDEVIAKALARPVAERFGTMQELAAILPRPR